jgi:hypothetical protein
MLVLYFIWPADIGQTLVNMGHHLENWADKPYWPPWPSRHTLVVNPWSKTWSNPLKPQCRWTSSGTFAVFSKFHLNTSKSTTMKVVQLVEGHNFHVDWHFKFWAEKGEKLGQLAVPPVHRDMAAFNVGNPILQNPLRKTPHGLCESGRG